MKEKPPVFLSCQNGGVRSKKFELISPKICRAGGIPPKPPFRPPTEATLSDWTISSFSLAANSLYNGLGIAEVGVFEIQMFNLALMQNRITNAQFSTSAPILANPCYGQFLFFIIIYVSSFLHLIKKNG